MSSCREIHIQPNIGRCKLAGLGYAFISSEDTTILLSRNPKNYYYYPNVSRYNEEGFIENPDSHELPSINDDLYALAVKIVVTIDLHCIYYTIQFINNLVLKKVILVILQKMLISTRRNLICCLL